MEKALELLITKAHPVVINFIAFVIGILVLIWIYSAIKTLKINVTAYETSNKLIKLQNKYNDLEKKSCDLGEKYNQSRVILAGIKSTFTETSYLMSLLASGQNIKGLGETYYVLLLIEYHLTLNILLARFIDVQSGFQ